MLEIQMFLTKKNDSAYFTRLKGSSDLAVDIQQYTRQLDAAMASFSVRGRIALMFCSCAQRLTPDIGQVPDVAADPCPAREQGEAARLIILEGIRAGSSGRGPHPARQDCDNQCGRYDAIWRELRRTVLIS